MYVLRKVFRDEQSRAYRIFNDILAALILASVLVIILESVPELHLKYGDLFNYAEIFFIYIFTIEYFLRIYVEDKKLNYILSPYGIIDLLAILPAYIALGISSWTDFRSLRVLRVLRILRLLRLFRVLKLLSYSKRTNSRFSMFKEGLSWYNIEIYLFTVFSVIVISGTLMFLIEGGLPGSGFTSIPDGLWWAVVTVTTTGYGDLIPVSPLGKILAGTTMIGGVILFAGLVAVMGRSLQKWIFGSTPEEEGKNQNE